MISIVICNYKSSKDIEQCVNSIMASDPQWNEYEYVVIDNASYDPYLPELKCRFPFVRIINADFNGGFAYACNIGIKATKHEHILLLNPDTSIKGDSIRKLHSRLIRTDVDIIGPKLEYPDGSCQSYENAKSYFNLWRIFCYAFFLSTLFSKSKIFNGYFRRYMNYDEENYVEQTCGAAFMFKRSVIAKIGGFDEKYFMYFEESDFCLRAIKANLKILYYPFAVIIHRGGLVSEEKWSVYTRYYNDSLKRFLRKHYSPFVANLSILIYFIGLLLRHMMLLAVGNRRHKYYFYSILNFLNL